MSFVPQYFEIRDVGKRIKSTKKQYIWRYQVDGKDVTIELFNSRVSGKKKVIVNGQLNAEIKGKKDTFFHPITAEGKRVTLQAVGEGFDLVYDSNFFQVLWEQEKRKNHFSWENRATKHDAFVAHQFGDNLDAIVKPTTREQGSAQAIELQLMTEEEKKGNADDDDDVAGSKPSSSKDKTKAKKKKALKELEKEKEGIVADLKNNFAEDEATVLIKDYMEGAYAKRIAEIDSRFGGNDDEARAASGNNSSDDEREARRERKRQRQQEEIALSSGDLAGAFDRLAVYDGTAEENNDQKSIASQPSQPQPANQPKEFDFNFDAAPQSSTASYEKSDQKAEAPLPSVDELLSGSHKRTGSFAAKQVDIFEFDKIPETQQKDPSSLDGIDINDPFNPNSARVRELQQEQAQAKALQQMQSQQPQFIPNPMSHQMEQMMMAQQKANAMQANVALAMHQQYQTNMMIHQQQMASQGGANPFMSQPGGNPFNTAQQPMMGGANPFQTGGMGAGMPPPQQQQQQFMTGMSGRQSFPSQPMQQQQQQNNNNPFNF